MMIKPKPEAAIIEAVVAGVGKLVADRYAGELEPEELAEQVQAAQRDAREVVTPLAEYVEHARTLRTRARTLIAAVQAIAGKGREP